METGHRTDTDLIKTTAGKERGPNFQHSDLEHISNIHISVSRYCLVFTEAQETTLNELCKNKHSTFDTVCG